MRDAPKLSWLNGKTFVQSNGGRKNVPGRKEEYVSAQAENISRYIDAAPEENSTPAED